MSYPTGSELLQAVTYHIDDEHILLACQKFKLQPRWVQKKLFNSPGQEVPKIIQSVMEYISTLPGVRVEDTTQNHMASFGQTLQ
jgi:hypothetical protein